MSVSEEVKQLAHVAFLAKGTDAYTAARAAVCAEVTRAGVSSFMVSMYADAVIEDAGRGFPAAMMLDVHLTADATHFTNEMEKIQDATINIENALKAQRLDDPRAWLSVKYEQAVRAKDIKAVNLYGRTLFLIETGLDPNTNARQRHPFMRRLYCETLEKIDAERETATGEIIELLKAVD